MTLTLLGFPADVRLEDHPDGVGILGDESARPRALSVTAVVWDAFSGAAVTAVAVFLVLPAAGPLSPDALGVDALTVGTSETFTFLFVIASSPAEISMCVGPGVLGIGAVVDLVYALIRSYQRTASRHG